MAGGTAGLGHKSYIQLHPETTYGVRVTTNPKRMEIQSFNIEDASGILEDSSLNPNPSRRFLLPGAKILRGSVRLRVNYEGMEEIFRSMLGGYTRTLVETTAFDHKFIEATGDAKSYSMEVVLGDIPTGQGIALLGTKFTRMTVRGAAAQGEGGMFSVEFDWTAKSVVLAASMTAGTFPAQWGASFIHSVSATTTDGATVQADRFLKEWEMTLTAPHTGDERIYFGGTTIGNVVRSGLMEVNLRIVEEFQSNAMYTAIEAGTVVAPILLLRDTTLLTGVSFREFELLAPKSLITSVSSPVEDYGIMQQTINYRSYYDSGITSIMQVRLRNAQAALPA